MLAQYRTTLTKEEVHKIKACGSSEAKNAMLDRYARAQLLLDKDSQPMNTGIPN